MVITNAMRNLCQTEMSNRHNSHASYLLFTIFNFTLNIAIIILNYALYIIKVVIEHVFDVKMTEKVKKRKRDTNQTSNQTVPKRGAIDANWQKLLSSSLMEEKKEKVEEKTNYTGTFRRARKKNKDLTNNVNIKTLNISNDKESESSKKENVEKERKQNKLTKFIAMDCEMVGVGYDGYDHMLARVSIVNKFGDCIYDKFVKAREEVVDYRTEISGIRKEDMLKGEDFNVVQKEVSEIIKGRILVGHSLKNDLSVLFLSHPKRNIRDTSRYKPFRKVKLKLILLYFFLFSFTLYL